MHTVLRDVAFVLQFWRAIEHIRLLSMTSQLRSVVSFAVLQNCVCGEHGKFVANEWDRKHRLRRDCMCCAGASVATRHPQVNVHLS